MPKNIFSKIFLESYIAKYQNYIDLRLVLDRAMNIKTDNKTLDNSGDNQFEDINEVDGINLGRNFDKQLFLEKIEGKLENIEEALQDFLQSVLGYRFGGAYNLTEVKMYCDNICNNLPLISNKSLAQQIRDYKQRYLDLLESHPNVNALLEVLKRIFGKYYDGKFGNYTDFPNGFENSEAVIVHKENSFIITKAIRPNTITLPSIFINNIDRTERILDKFIESIRNSNLVYNIFNNAGYDAFSEIEKRKMLFETIILNATTFDLSNIDLFFERYSYFVRDPILGSIKGLHYLGDKFNDQLYCKLNQSDIEYETPYYLSFMAANHHFELPNVRLSISAKENRAYIVAVQSSQRTPNNNPEIMKDIKDNMPKNGVYRFYNPMHLASLTLAFGFLNGIGIQTVNVVDYMPIRYYKTIKDKGMNEIEAERYLTRLTDKNICTFFKLESLAEGIDLINFPGTGYNMVLQMQDEVVCANEYMQHLYDMGYEFGKSQVLSSIDQSRSLK